MLRFKYEKYLTPEQRDLLDLYRRTYARHPDQIHFPNQWARRVSDPITQEMLDNCETPEERAEVLMGVELECYPFMIDTGELDEVGELHPDESPTNA